MKIFSIDYLEERRAKNQFDREKRLQQKVALEMKKCKKRRRLVAARRRRVLKMKHWRV